uniref:MD-2-related lipid-recognition domain-containing protein n=1 Tax=Anopheles coluzzii TaxID=1518534 RepID=A0A6E8VYH6_ANOCL
MLIGLFSLLLSVSVTLQVMQIDFERFEQLSGYDVYNSSLRVRKYNRTAVVINGTIELMVPLSESVMVSSDFFHSRLGNQQFNHYPAKFPTQNVCEFVQRFYEDYSEYCEHVVNLPRNGECPIAPRIIYVHNKPFPAKSVPPFFPTGLWKVQMAHTLNNIEIVRVEVIIKATHDLGI